MSRLPGKRAAGLRAAALTLPLVAFIVVTFVAPLGAMLVRSVHDPLVADTLPKTLSLLREWDGADVPDERVFEAAAAELSAAWQTRALGRVATRINRVESGLRSVLTRSVRKLRRIETDSWREAMIEAHPAWGEAATWRAIRRAG